MPRKHCLFTIIILCVLCFSAPHLYSSDHSAEEVNNIITAVETKLLELKKSGAEDYAKEDLLEIERRISGSRELLKKDNEDQAYFEINIGKLYFKKIEARKHLFDAEIEYSELKNSLK